MYSWLPAPRAAEKGEAGARVRGGGGEERNSQRAGEVSSTRERLCLGRARHTREKIVLYRRAAGAVSNRIWRGSMACGLAVHPCPAGEEARMPYNPSYTTYLFFCTKNNISNSIRDAREFHFQIQFARAPRATRYQPTRERVPRPPAVVPGVARSPVRGTAPRTAEARSPAVCVCVCAAAGGRCQVRQRGGRGDFAIFRLESP